MGEMTNEATEDKASADVAGQVDPLVRPLAYLVLDETGEPIYCASWPGACHEHINDAINEYDFTEAAKWRVIAVAEVPYVR